MELTAPPRSFTSSLATAQNPALISESRPSLLTTGSSVSVLRMAEPQHESFAAQPKSSPVAHSSRQWMPPLNIQRAALGGAETSPSPTPPLMSSDSIEPYVEVATPSASFVEAPDPDQPRIVPVADHIETSRPSLVVAGGPRETALQRTVESGAPASSAQPQPQVVSVQPIGESTGDAPAAQRSAVDDVFTQASTTPAIPDALRTVPVVDFSPPAGVSLHTITEAARGTTPSTDTAAPITPLSHTAPPSAAPSPAGAQPVVSAVQRTAVDDPAPDAPHTAPPVEFSRPDSVSLHTDAGATVGEVTNEAVPATPPPSLLATTPSPRITATKALPLANTLQRNVVSDGDGVAPTVRPIATPVTPVSRAAVSAAPQVGGLTPLQRAVGGPGEAMTSVRAAAVPVVDDGRHTSFTSFTADAEPPGLASTAEFSAPLYMQRSSAHIVSGEGTHHTVTTAPTPTQAATRTNEFGLLSAPMAFESPIARSDTPVTQRAVLTGNSESASVTATAFSTAITTAPGPTDGPPSPGRIVLLPPVRNETREPAGQTREVLADSGRPMSLQRMFGDFAQTTTDPDIVPPRTHGTVQAVAFDAPTAQREALSESDPMPAVQTISEQALPEHAPSAPAASAPAAAHAPAQAPADVDELVGRLYEPLAARLRAELWLDRERAGALMGLHR
jgi:hypothetical protein